MTNAQRLILSQIPCDETTRLSTPQREAIKAVVDEDEESIAIAIEHDKAIVEEFQEFLRLKAAVKSLKSQVAVLEGERDEATVTFRAELDELKDINRRQAAEIQRLRAHDEELRFSVESLLAGLVDLAPHAARARGVLGTVKKSDLNEGIHEKT